MNVKWVGLSLFWTLLHSPLIAGEKKTFTFYTGIENEKRFHIVETRLREAFRRQGYNFVLEKYPAQRALMRANQMGDGDAHRVENLKQLVPRATENLIRIPVPIFVANTAVFVLRGNEFEVKGWHSLKKFKYNGNRIGDRLATKFLPHPYLVNSNKQLFLMLRKKRLDTVIAYDLLGLEIIAQPDFKDIQMLKPPILTRYFYPYLHKKYKDLVPLLTESLRKMQKDGSYDKIERSALPVVLRWDIDSIRTSP